MSYNYDWNEILDVYVKRIAAPDGRDTFESTTELVSDIIKIAELKSSDTLIDIGSGWGNTAIPLSQKVSHITGIEPDKKNIGEAEKRTQNLQIKNIQYIQGSFEKPNCNITADKIISSLAFHQVAYGKRFIVYLHMGRYEKIHAEKKPFLQWKRFGKAPHRFKYENHQKEIIHTFFSA
jgi:SAM-dependent methyltransferases related to tRNA (uracil-5-)-methyltransferase